MAKTFEKIFLGIIFVLLIEFNSFFIFGSQNTENEEKKIVEKIQKEITEEQARFIALKTANGAIKEIKEKTVNGITFYEVELEDELTETEIKIDKKDGDILQVKQEEKDDEDGEEVTKEELQKITGKISEKQAIEVALELVDGKVIHVGAEKERGRLIYEVELESQGDVVEIEIDAETGKVLEVEWGDD